jgi:hypothetical protein
VARESDPIAGTEPPDVDASDGSSRRPRWTWLAGRTRHWFVLSALLCILGFVVFTGTAQAMVEAAAVLVLWGACIRYVMLAVRDDQVRSLIVARRGLVGWMAADSGSGRRRAAARRRAAETQPVADGRGPPPSDASSGPDSGADA